MTNHMSAFAPLGAIVIAAFFSLGFIGTASAAPPAPSVEIRNFYSAWVSTQSYRAGSVVNFSGASDRWNSVMELFMAGGNYAASQVPLPKGLPAAVDAEIAAAK